MTRLQFILPSGEIVEPRPDSRRSCQLKVSDALDGAQFRIPAGQR